MTLDEEQFKKDLQDLHLVYDYAVNENGKQATWRYEAWFPSSDRVVYAIHGGPMAGRKNFQTAQYQCIRAGEIWQCNWLEETGTLCSAVYDLKENKVSTLIGFSKGHWENAKDALGDKRNKEDFERWRKLAEIGKQTDRHLLSEQGAIVESFQGRGDLEPIDHSSPTI